MHTRDAELRTGMQVGFATLRAEFVEGTNRQIKWSVTSRQPRRGPTHPLTGPRTREFRTGCGVAGVDPCDGASSSELSCLRPPIGGAMMPLEFFPDTMRTIANITPHAWGYEAFAEIQRRDGTLADIAPQLGVLAAMAAVLLALGAWSLRRSLGRPM